MQSASCIIGAGYSFAAGLPLTKDLFGSGVVILSRRAEKRFALVLEDYENWRQKYPYRNLEEYLADLYHFKEDLRSPPFSYAVELIAALSRHREDTMSKILIQDTVFELLNHHIALPMLLSGVL